MIINIGDDILKLNSMGLINKLLADKTTKKNIMWATDAYRNLGERFERNQEIKSERITGSYSDVIKTRARKAMEQQAQRTKQHAEVFTPLWIVQKMNDYADEVWFGRGNVFFDGATPTAEIEFPPDKPWQTYVDSRRLEITCGEAPYLVTRYNVETGEAIEVENRAGILDRKLRVVNENAKTQEEWLKWTYRALESTYGYEFQGDNLLIARVNLLMTFEENLQFRWGRKPALTEYIKAANIIVWNMWQMDGLTDTIPYNKATDNAQLNLFDYFDPEEHIKKIDSTQPHCYIYNWRAREPLEFKTLKGDNKKMKFDFIIGNPPYQDETLGENKNFAPPIYNLFMDEAYEIGDKVELITPARFLFNAGYTPKTWNQKMLNDPHFKVLYYESNAKAIFKNTSFEGGVAITLRDATSNFGPIIVFNMIDELVSINEKVSESNMESFSSIVYAAESYRFTKLMHDENPNVENLLSKGHKNDLKSSVFTSLDNIVFFKEKPDNGKYIKIAGLFKTQRVYRWIKADYIRTPDNFMFYKVLLPKSNGSPAISSGKITSIIGTPFIGQPYTGHTQTFISIGKLSNEQEANAVLKYIKTQFVRSLLGILKVTQDNPPEKWKHVPLQDFTANSDIDWSRSVAEIDRQLYAKYGLDDNEIAFIESHVKEMK